MEKLFALILSVPDAVKVSSWQTKGSGGHAENVETDITKQA